MVSTRGVKFKYIEGERVLCYEPDPTKAKVLYESKVLDLVVTRDSRGRKVSEYLVHFYGWNSSWDRCVNEDFVLSDNEENRALQKRLAEEASINLKGKKRLHKVGSLLKDSFHKKKCSDGTKENGNPSKEGSKWQDSESSQDEESSEDDDMDQETEEEEEEEDYNPYTDIELSENLKSKLEDDCLNITTHNKLLKLPCEPNVIDILETYAKQVGVSLLCPTTDSKEKQRGSAHFQHIRIQNKIHLTKEMVDGLRVCFDFTLPLVLLYKQERQQFKDIISKPFLIQQKEPTLLHNFTTLTPNLTQPTEPVRTRERSSFGPTHHSSTDNFKGKPISESYNSSPAAHPDEESYVITTTRARSRFTRENQSPPGSSGDEGQRMKRVLRSTERLRLEEDGLRKADPSLELESASGPDSPTISFKHIPPGSSLLPSEIPRSNVSSKGEGSSASSSHSDSTVEQHLEVKEVIPDSTGLLNDLMKWQLLPAHLCLNQNMHTPPSFVYGAHHLLRLFVKLPDYLDQMSIPKNKRGSLIKHLKTFIQYFDEKNDQLLLSSAYSDADVNA